jgi:hypothetical protein
MITRSRAAVPDHTHSPGLDLASKLATLLMPPAKLIGSMALAGILSLLSSCVGHSLVPVELGKNAIDHQPPCSFTIERDVDILFVIDNSGSMGAAQANLANNFGAFIETLEDDELALDYRIGITTTDNGNPWCPGTTPEGGNLVMSSCKDRIDEFSFVDSRADASDIACNDICKLDARALEILPTRIEQQHEAAPRPWLERIDGQQNLPATTDMAEAFKCFGPQGINGCGFESPLESMYLALLRADADSEASYGFLRSSATLAVIFVTDEADCSYNKAFSQVFEPDGDKVFWSDPTVSSPTSALCWNAGVSCSGDPSSYDSCDSINKDVLGNEGVGDEHAVLHPMSRYLGQLDRLEAEKWQYQPDHQIIVGLIGGVGSDGVPIYRDASDTNPAFQASFGIGPGCQAVNPNDPDDVIQAVPPVRLRELVDAFTPGNMFSICEPDYTDALTTIAKSLAPPLTPSCYTRCVADTDASTLVLDPECSILERHPGSSEADADTIRECLRGTEGYAIDSETGDYVMPSDDANVCYAMLTDHEDATATSSDDMSGICEDLHYNLELVIERRPGFPAPNGTSVSALCSLSEFPAVDCPGIGS